jgi:hypothetical protein
VTINYEIKLTTLILLGTSVRTVEVKWCLPFKPNTSGRVHSNHIIYLYLPNTFFVFHISLAYLYNLLVEKLKLIFHKQKAVIAETEILYWRSLGWTKEVHKSNAKISSLQRNRLSQDHPNTKRKYYALNCDLW